MGGWWVVLAWLSHSLAWFPLPPSLPDCLLLQLTIKQQLVTVRRADRTQQTDSEFLEHSSVDYESSYPPNTPVSSFVVSIIRLTRSYKRCRICNGVCLCIVHTLIFLELFKLTGIRAIYWCCYAAGASNDRLIFDKVQKWIKYFHIQYPECY